MSERRSSFWTNLLAFFGFGKRWEVLPSGIVSTGSGKTPYHRALKKRNYALAAKIAQEIIDTHPDNHQGYMALGHALLFQANYSLAALQYDKAIDLADDPTTPLYNRGFVAQEMEDFETARDFYRRSLEISPDYAESHFGMAAACEGLALDREVIHHAERFLSLWPQSPLADQARDMIQLAREELNKTGNKFP